MPNKRVRTVGVSEEREFIIECIRFYRQLPALWDVKSKLYYNKKQKTMAYDLLLTKYKEMFTDATRDDLKKKLNVLRTNYRKELKKYMTAMASGDTSYEPSLWYFEDMYFLYDEQSLDMDPLNDTTQNPSKNEEHSESETSALDENEDSKPTNECRFITDNNSVKKETKNDQLLEVIYDYPNQKHDEFNHWAMACASDLRKMDKTQQVYAKKAFAEIIMEGQLGRLHRDSVKINESPTRTVHIHRHHHQHNSLSSLFHH